MGRRRKRLTLTGFSKPICACEVTAADRLQGVVSRMLILRPRWLILAGSRLAAALRLPFCGPLFSTKLPLGGGRKWQSALKHLYMCKTWAVWQGFAGNL